MSNSVSSAASGTPVIFSTPEELAGFGAELAEWIGPGDMVTLHGDLGAGKTTLARGLVQSWLGAQGLPPEDVPSPTFTIVQVYEGATYDLWHVDLYRIESVDEIAELALDEAAEIGALIVEWPEKLGALLPDERLELHIEIAKNGSRQVRMIASKTWQIRFGQSTGSIAR